MCATTLDNKILVNEKYAPALISAIKSAVVSIDVMMFDWKWYKSDFSCDVSLINHALVDAVRRGVKVRVISNSADISSYFLPLGIAVRPYKVRGIFHAKLFVFDRSSFLIGSHNMTEGAMCRNYEVSLLSNDVDSSISFSNLFNSLWQ